MTDINDIKKAMDNMPLGDGSAFAEISVGPAKHEQFLDAHYKKLIVIGVILVAIIAGLIIYHGMNKSMERKAGGMLVNAVPTSRYDDAVTNLHVDTLQGVINQYPNSQAAITADYMEALALWNAGKEAEGIAKMQSFIASAPSPEWVSQASTVLGCRFMNQGKDAEAKALFEAVVDQGNPIFAPFALLCLGDMANATGNADAAMQAYKKVTEKFADSTFSVPTSRDDVFGGVLVRQKLFGIAAPEKVAPTPRPTPEIQTPNILDSNTPEPNFDALKIETNS